MFSNHKLRTAVRLGLGLGTGALAVGLAPGALAQGADATSEPLEEIVTTGSRIKRADIDSASPVTVLQRDDLLAFGVTDVGNIIQKMPSMSGSPVGTTTNNGGNGSVSIDLRGMGPDRTVTLVNGQRTVDGGDFQTIPSTMIERVEILKDGASAIYGADAVAGVVNIITRRDFEGLELSAQASDFENMKSGSQESFSLIAGKNFGDGNFVFGAEYVTQEQARQADAPWAFFQDSYYIYPGGCENQVAAPYDGTPTGGCYPVGSSRIPESRLSFLTQGTFLIGTPASQPYEVGLMQAHDGRTYNYAPVNYIQTPYERTNLFAEGHFDLTENVRFNAEIRGNLRTSSQLLAPLPFTGGDPMYNGTFNGTPYTGVSEESYYLRRAVDAYNATGPATPLVYEPLSNPRRRMIETARSFDQDVQQYQFVAGLEGSINDKLDWDVFYNAGYRSRVDHDFGQFSGVRLFNALGPSADLDGDGQPECYTNLADPSTLIVGCVPLNLFGGGAVDAGGSPTVTTLTQDMINYVSLNTVDTYITKQEIFGGSVSGALFTLPGGEMGWAAGYNYWKQDYAYTPDSAKTIGAVTGNVGAGTDGSLISNSLFAEFLAPVFDNGSQSLDLKGGVRYDDYNAFGGDTTWQFGAELHALDNLKLRATAGTVFRAPTISNLYGGIVDDFPTYSDPCIPNVGDPLPPGCAQVGIQTDSQLHALVGGNPNLIPETGDTFTAGIVWTPEFGNGDLSLTVDYWQVDIEQGISSLGVQFILDDCYIDQNAASCALITRSPTYDIVTVVDGSLNVANQGANGIDTEARYALDTDGAGTFEFALLWSHLNERTKTPFPGADEQVLDGTYTNRTAQDGGAYPNDKFNYSVQWMKDSFSLSYMGEYVGEMDTEDAGFVGGYVYTIDSILYHDIVGSYSFPFGTTISAGLTNITDEAPPYIDLGFNAKTDVAAYRLFGRGYYLRLTHAFE